MERPTVNTILRTFDLTEMEIAVVKALNELLKGNFGEDYSDVDAPDLARATGYTVPQIKGVVGSLTKKGIVCDPWGGESKHAVIGFCQQQKMAYELAT